MPVEFLEAPDAPEDAFDLDVRETEGMVEADNMDPMSPILTFGCGTPVTCTLSVGCCCP